MKFSQCRRLRHIATARVSIRSMSMKDREICDQLMHTEGKKMHISFLKNQSFLNLTIYIYIYIKNIKHVNILFSSILTIIIYFHNKMSLNAIQPISILLQLMWWLMGCWCYCKKNSFSEMACLRSVVVFFGPLHVVVEL